MQVIIAGAGGAAHLPGMVAALTPLPVIGVPVTPKGAHLDGMDALMSVVQVRPTSLLSCLLDVACVTERDRRPADAARSSCSHCRDRQRCQCRLAGGQNLGNLSTSAP